MEASVWMGLGRDLILLLLGFFVASFRHAYEQAHSHRFEKQAKNFEDLLGVIRRSVDNVLEYLVMHQEVARINPDLKNNPEGHEEGHHAIWDEVRLLYDMLPNVNPSLHWVVISFYLSMQKIIHISQEYGELEGDSREFLRINEPMLIGHYYILSEIRDEIMDCYTSFVYKPFTFAWRVWRARRIVRSQIRFLEAAIEDGSVMTLNKYGDMPTRYEP